MKHFNINQVQVKESVMKAWKLKKVKKRNLGGNFRLHEWKIKLISTFRYHVLLLYRDHAEKLQILSGFWLKFSVCEYVLLHALTSVRLRPWYWMFSAITESQFVQWDTLSKSNVCLSYQIRLEKISLKNYLNPFLVNVSVLYAARTPETIWSEMG